MNSPGSFLEEPQVLFLQRLIDDVKTGSILVPRFQREFVWDDSDRLRLLESIRDGIPVGSLLVWRTTSPKLKTFPRIGGVPIPQSDETQPRLYQYLLDGHQRLSTLFSALSPPPADLSLVEKDDWELTAGDIYYDLDSEKFVTTPDSSEQRLRFMLSLPELLPLYKLFNSAGLLSYQRQLAKSDPEQAELWIGRADSLAERFRNYKIPIIPIVTDDLGTAVTAFQRVNSSGVSMSDVHMVRALTYSDTYDLSISLSDSHEKLLQVGWGNLDDKYLIGVIRMRRGLAVASPDAESTAKLFRQEPYLLDEATKSSVEAAKWLWDNCWIPSPDFLPYSYQFVLLAAAFAEMGTPSHAIASNLATWVWKTALSGQFKGIRDVELKKAYDVVLATLEGKPLEAVATDQLALSNIGPKYNFRMARVKVIASLLLKRRMKSLGEPERLTALSYIREAGADCMGKIIPFKAPLHVVSSFANRVLLFGDHERIQFSMPRTLDLTPEMLNELVISERALIHLKAGNYELFEEARMYDIQDLETELFEEVGIWS